MRWFVEVSRVGENGVADEYCVEAKQWQAALQEARKLRGDLGALSKFSIELLDQGYRAVDPSLKLRYLINEAPPDAPLTGSGEYEKKHANKAERASRPRLGESAAPPSVYATSLAPTPFTTSLAPPANSSPVPRPTSSIAPRPGSVIPPRVAPSDSPRAMHSDPPRAVPSDPPRALPSDPPRAVPSDPPRAVPSDPPRAVPSDPPRAVPSDPPRAKQLTVPDDPVPPAPPLPGGLGFPSQPPAPAVPQFELVRQRAEEPRPDSPITYREFAYAVEPGRTRGEVEALLRDRYQATRAEIEDRPPGKFVQLAVFDHVFKRRPERPPLATFAWKDWRGDPVLAFPGFGEEAMGPMSRVPPPPESVPPSNGVATPVRPSVVPESAPVVPMALVVISSSPPPPASAVEATPAPVVEATPASVVEPALSVDVEIPIDVAAPSAPAAEVEIPIDVAPSAPVADVEIPIEVAPSALAVDVEIPITEATSAPALVPAPAMEVEVPSAEPAPEPAAKPSIAEATLTPSIWSVEAASAPALAAEAPVPIMEGGRAPVHEPLAQAPAVAPTPAPEMPVSIVEGGRAPVVETPPPPAAAPSFELSFEAPLVAASAPALTPSNPAAVERGSRPRIAVEGRRRAGEDLIGELFEIMHDLHFARDVAEGADFVLSVLEELLPCEGVLIHVFDINTGHFVVVRAKGPEQRSVLLQRMSDQDPLVRSVMRSAHAVSVKNAAEDARFTGPRWQALGVTPRAVLCGGVQLGGRYLGLIEIANPHGDIPFHQSELNALDYICEQFAAFLSKKPIVLSADVVLSPA